MHWYIALAVVAVFNSQTVAAGVTCEEGYTRCPLNNKKCIRDSFFCDGDNDCMDESDEDPSFCASRVCRDGELRCANGQCLDKTDFCSGRIRCRDDSVDRENGVCVSASDDEPPSDYEPIEVLPWAMCLMNAQAACISDTRFASPSSLKTFVDEIPRFHLSVSCAPLLEINKCTTKKLSQCDESAIRSIPEEYKRYINATTDAINYVCEQHVDEFEQLKHCVFLDLSGLQLDIGMSCAHEFNQITTILEQLCEGSPPQPDLSCIYGVIQNKCGSEGVAHLRELMSKILADLGCTTASHHVKRSNGGLNVLKRFLRLYHLNRR